MLSEPTSPNSPIRPRWRARAGSDRADSGVSHCGRSPRRQPPARPGWGSGQVKGSSARLRSVWPFGGPETTTSKADVFLHADLLSYRSDSGARMPLCVGGGWLLLGVAGSLLGVGRYGESVPLLLNSRTLGQKEPDASRRR